MERGSSSSSGCTNCWPRSGNPHHDIPIVHVAGTKGKGLDLDDDRGHPHGRRLRTGLFTSPHLVNLEERIAVDGQSCSSDELVALVERLQPIVDRMDRRGRAARGRVRADLFRADHRDGALVLRRSSGSKPPCWRSAWGAGSIRPTSACRRSRSSPASASTTSPARQHAGRDRLREGRHRQAGRARRERRNSTTSRAP